MQAARTEADAEPKLDGAGAAAAMPTLEPDPLRPAAQPGDDARVRAALATADPLYFDRLAPLDLALTRGALDRAATLLRSRVEARSVMHLRGARWGRRLALGVLGLWAAVAGAHRLLALPNVALHKPVIPSSVWYTPVAEQTLVDGDTGTSFGVHTRMEDSPNAVIDLLDTYRIQRIAVHNRVDGWFDDCLPLVVEISTDGKHYEEVGRREAHFDADPPWVVDVPREAARYVRVRLARKGYLALSEVEVFGKKK